MIRVATRIGMIRFTQTAMEACCLCVCVSKRPVVQGGFLKREHPTRNLIFLFSRNFPLRLWESFQNQRGAKVSDSAGILDQRKVPSKALHAVNNMASKRFLEK